MRFHFRVIKAITYKWEKIMKLGFCFEVKYQIEVAKRSDDLMKNGKYARRR